MRTITTVIMVMSLWQFSSAQSALTGQFASFGSENGDGLKTVFASDFYTGAVYGDDVNTTLGFLTVLAFLQQSTATANPDYVNAFDVYPNPASTELHMELQLERDLPVSIELMNLNGMKLPGFSEHIDGSNWSGVKNIAQLSAGLYVVIVRSGQEGILAATTVQVVR